MHLFVQVDRILLWFKIKIKRFNIKITYFLKNHVPSLFTFFESLCNLQIFYHVVFRCKVLNPLFFFCFFFFVFFFEVWSRVLVSFFNRKKMCWFSSYLIKREGKKLGSIFTKSRKLCLHKIFNIVGPRKLIPVNFVILCSM